VYVDDGISGAEFANRLDAQYASICTLWWHPINLSVFYPSLDELSY